MKPRGRKPSKNYDLSDNHEKMITLRLPLFIHRMISDRSRESLGLSINAYLMDLILKDLKPTYGEILEEKTRTTTIPQNTGTIARSCSEENTGADMVE